MIVCPKCGSPLTDPYVGQGIPDTADDLLALLEDAQPPSTALLGKLREFVESTPLPDNAGHTIEQGWQFALDTYREWGGLDLRQPVVQDAALMTLVHVRNAMLANGAWSPEDDIASRVVWTMLRLYSHERLRQT
jgi:hypothetical protein